MGETTEKIKEMMIADVKGLEKAVHKIRKLRRQCKRKQITQLQDAELELESILYSSDESLEDNNESDNEVAVSVIISINSFHYNALITHGFVLKVVKWLRKIMMRIL